MTVSYSSDHYTKDVDFFSDTNVVINGTSTATGTINLYDNIYFDPQVEDNTAALVLDAQAVGEDTAVDVNASVQAIENTLSSVSVVAIATTENDSFYGW